MKRTRSGSLMVETVTAIVLITVALVAVSQLLLAAGRHQRILESRRIALLAAANLMEQAMALPYDQLTPAQLDSLTLDDNAKQHLRNARPIFRISDMDESLAGRQVELELTWEDLAGERVRESLVAWKYPNEAQP